MSDFQVPGFRDLEPQQTLGFTRMPKQTLGFARTDLVAGSKRIIDEVFSI